MATGPALPTRPRRIAYFAVSTVTSRPQPIQKGLTMGLDDKINNKAEEVAGKVKKGAGKATGDKDLEAEGRVDEAKSDVKQAVEKIKDAFKS
jgi:uncharacterized protein YjbJ (UPF0337 family)